MHDTNIVHGNIKAVGNPAAAQLNPFLTRNQSSVLIKNGSPPRACLSGFGSISSPGQELSVLDGSDGIPWRYFAPELIHPPKFGLEYAKTSRETDVYGFGLLVLEVITPKYHVTVV